METIAESTRLETSVKCSAIALKQGVGRCSAQYGELFQGQIRNGHGGHHRCLVSLPCSALSSTVTFDPHPGGRLEVSPPDKQKVRIVTSLTLAYCGMEKMGGTIAVTSNIPEAKGCGSSTADCVAAVIAAARAIGAVLTQQEIAKLVVQAEIASDNLMFDQAVLFAHRDGIVLTDYGRQIPSLEVIGVDTAEEELVDTLEFPPAVYTPGQIETFEGLTRSLHKAIIHDDRALLGEVATASASINQVFLPKPMFDEIRQIAAHADALGVAVAHSGTVLAILLDPRRDDLERKAESIEHGLETLGVSKILRYRV